MYHFDAIVKGPFSLFLCLFTCENIILLTHLFIYEWDLALVLKAKAL